MAFSVLANWAGSGDRRSGDKAGCLLCHLGRGSWLLSAVAPCSMVSRPSFPHPGGLTGLLRVSLRFESTYGLPPLLLGL